MTRLNAGSQWQDNLQSPVAVLLGGESAEREVSLQSGAAVLQALKDQNIAAVAIDTGNKDWLQQLEGNYHHCFIALHGGDGENGTIQQQLEQIGMTYTGSGVAASALAMDKIQCKQLWQGIGLPTPEFLTLSDDSDWQGIINDWQKVIIKPAHEGSSIGMAVASDAAELVAAYRAAREFDDVVMVEQWISGAEYTVAILGADPLPVIRLETDNRFYDYDAKYISNDTRYICPCGLTAQQEKNLQQLAVEAFNSIGCSGWGRVDFMQDQHKNFYLLEVNTVPGMTSHSLVPMAAKAAGISMQQLVVEILSLSVAAGQQQ